MLIFFVLSELFEPPEEGSHNQNQSQKEEKGTSPPQKIEGSADRLHIHYYHHLCQGSFWALMCATRRPNASKGEDGGQ